MSNSVQRSILAAGLAILCAPIYSVHAQTTLELSYDQPSPCIFVTDLEGIHLDPATGHLLAHGAFGAGCQTSVPNPVFTDPLAGDIPASVAVGTDLTLTWAATATSCVYNGSSFPDGFTTPNWQISGSACDSAASCAAAHSATVTASVAGTYRFNLTCTNGNNPNSVSSAATTVAGGGAGQCMTGPTGLTQATTATLKYLAHVPPQTAANQDITQYSNIWGRFQMGDPILPWPERDRALVGIVLDRNQYISAQFTVPAVPIVPHGRISRGNTGDTVNFTTSSISETCGDFVNVPGPKCVYQGNAASKMVEWSINGVVPNTCPLTPGHTYYLNIMMSPIDNPTDSFCDSSSCQLSVVPSLFSQ